MKLSRAWSDATAPDCVPASTSRNEERDVILLRRPVPGSRAATDDNSKVMLISPTEFVPLGRLVEEYRSSLERSSVLTMSGA